MKILRMFQKTFNAKFKNNFEEIYENLNKLLVKF